MDGGGVSVAEGGVANLNRCNLFDNRAQGGGGINIMLETQARLASCKIYNNFAKRTGGGMLTAGDATLSTSIIHSNIADVSVCHLVHPLPAGTYMHTCTCICTCASAHACAHGAVHMHTSHATCA